MVFEQAPEQIEKLSLPPVLNEFAPFSLVEYSGKEAQEDKSERNIERKSDNIGLLGLIYTSYVMKIVSNEGVQR